jgi:DNA-binding transcriptional MerR regulator
MEKPAYTIKQAAQQTGISEDTIRYYEKIALLPRAKRKDNGHRVYNEEDIEALRLIACLKKTGLPLEEMRPFLTVSMDADPGEYPELVERVRSHRENIVSQIASLQQVVDFIDTKLASGTYRRDPADVKQDCRSDGTISTPKPVSAMQMSYFQASPERERV